MLKRAYVSCIRASRTAAEHAGVLAGLERRSAGSRAALWLRSLFAIYDIADMAALDLPWWTLAAIVEANRFLGSHPRARVFEYGSGASTIWLARRAAVVVSIEHDRDWHAVVSECVAPYPNVTLKLIEPDAEPSPGYFSEKKAWKGRSFRNYVHAIEGETGKFDLIVIDGRARAACLARARGRLARGGIILFDNTNRRRYRIAISSSNMSARVFRGLTACLPYPDETTLLSDS